MKNFKQRDSKRGGFGGDRGRGDDKPAFFGKSRGGDRSTDREQRMFKAVCSDCKKSCDVPFKPSNDKPVFCRDCFSAKRDRETREYKAGLANGDTKKFGQDKSVSHSGSTHTPFVSSQADESTKKQLAEMSARIDKLTSLVEKMVEDKKTVAVETSASVSKLEKSMVPVKKAVSKSVAAKKVAPKVVTKKSITKVAVAPKVVVKKVAAKKVVIAKKVVVAKKVATKKVK